MDQNQTQPYKIGLSMAGAVSAGAYTAGVLDFLVEALDAWEAAQLRGERVPMHSVSLEAASGASAGAMCSALLCILLPGRFPHVRIDEQYQAHGDEGAPALNQLYRSWVEAIGIAPLLDTSDLAGGQLDSLLNCQVIDDIIRQALAFSGPPQPRGYVQRPFVARFTLGNLRGVPYRIGFRGLRGDGNQESMTQHADYHGFLIGGDPASARGKDWLHGHEVLPERSINGLPEWQKLGGAAAASGAFPLFLKPRLIERSADDYADRNYVASSLEGAIPQPIPPGWDPKLEPKDLYAFASVDGGMFNNEPFELVHEVIAGGPGLVLPRTPEDACGSVLMVDPFMAAISNGRPPPTAPDPVTGGLRLLLPPEQQLAPLAQAWLMQSRFKPADLSLAYDEDNYDRYIVAPDGSNSPPAAPYWIASGALGGFLGFFHEDFRKHDYQLGRRNCQQFLREHYTVPKSNRLLGAGRGRLKDGEFCSSDGQYQIIPLVGALAQNDEALLPWPAGRFDPQQAMPQVTQRLDAVFDFYSRRLAADFSRNPVLQWLARLVPRLAWSCYGRARLSGAVLQALVKAKELQHL